MNYVLQILAYIKIIPMPYRFAICLDNPEAQGG
jgi:hypothetical protein